MRCATKTNLKTEKILSKLCRKNYIHWTRRSSFMNFLKVIESKPKIHYMGDLL